VTVPRGLQIATQNSAYDNNGAAEILYRKFRLFPETTVTCLSAQSIYKRLPKGTAQQSIRAGELVFFGNSLERLGCALDPIGKASVAFDRQLANDLVFAARGIVSELRFVIDVLASGKFVAHVRPSWVGFGLHDSLLLGCL
jgi:hypothetical protein